MPDTFSNTNLGLRFSKRVAQIKATTITLYKIVECIIWYAFSECAFIFRLATWMIYYLIRIWNSDKLFNDIKNMSLITSQLYDLKIKVFVYLARIFSVFWILSKDTHFIKAVCFFFNWNICAMCTFETFMGVLIIFLI